MIFIWVCIILVGLLGVFSTVYIGVSYNARNKNKKLALMASCIVAAILIICALHWILYSTESGERMQKSFKSQTDGGLYRIVRVYDMQGEQIAEYKGKFDVAEDNLEGVTKIKFDSDGKRHIIYSSTGTVIIDEIAKDKE